MTKKCTYTPGPWSWYENKPGTAFLIFDSKDRLITSPSWHSSDDTYFPLKPESEANTRLMASAPDLLALARQYASECAECGGSAEIVRNDRGGDPDDDYCVPCNQCEDIWAVIDKAEGKV